MSPEKLAAPPAVRTVVVLTHTHPEQTSDAVRAAGEIATEMGCTLLATEEERAKHGDVTGSVERLDSLPGEPDLCLVLGGDGTILQALRVYADTGVPVFGINFGTIGFLAASERDELEDGLRRALAGDFEVMSMPALEVAADVERPLALNDVSLIRRPHGRVAELAYSVGGQEVGHVRCDGLVAATPAGSTGYNLANQGPILAWGVEGYVVSFIAPHTLTARALVVAPNDALTVRNAAGRDPVDVVLDGAHVAELPSGGEMEVRFRDGVGRLAQLPGSNFYRRIREKFGRLAQ
ncbi:MAG TPA: NAD(+)/NADH kinase [Solirubrobacterales bacterium]|nr:NAD(+)/NADH kinase [Solirubrobacterales bacterium]